VLHLSWLVQRGGEHTNKAHTQSLFCGRQRVCDEEQLLFGDVPCGMFLEYGKSEAKQWRNWAQLPAVQEGFQGFRK
jgi:hypothetical protein